MDKTIEPQAPVLTRLANLEAHLTVQQTELNTVQDRITQLEHHLSEVLGVSCKWTPPPEPVKASQLNRVR